MIVNVTLFAFQTHWLESNLCPVPNSMRENSTTVFMAQWSILDIRFTDVRRDKCSPPLLLQLNSYAVWNIKLTES